MSFNFKNPCKWGLLKHAEKHMFLQHAELGQKIIWLPISLICTRHREIDTAKGNVTMFNEEIYVNYILYDIGNKMGQLS